MNGKEAIKILKKHRWIVTRVKGSHYMLKKDGVTVPVPVHGSRDLGKGLLSKIQKQTGVNLK